MSTKARAAEELEAALPPLKLDDSPAYRDEWSRQHPALSLLYHHDVITHLVWCVVACRYLTGGADGEVKIWKFESSHARSGPAAAEERHAGGPARPWLLPERHVMTLNGPVTGLCLAEREAGSSEVAIIASTDGTLTLCRTNTGEVVRILRGARGESIESFRIPALRTRGGSAAETEAGEGGGGKGAARRDVGPSRSYAADAVSRRLAPMSDLALVRRPVYAIHAYRDEVRDVFTGPSNGFFHGLRAVAPTYAHLAPHEETVADVLAGFGIPAATSGEATSTAVVPASSSSPSRQWYASTVALSVAPDARRGPSTEADAAPSQDLYLFLGFPEGLLQVYVLPRRWFQLHLHGETRLDPPSLRFPVLSVPAHAAAVLRIEVFAAKDLVVSVSEDGTTQLRRLTALQAPLRQLGVRVAPMSHGMSATPMGTSLTALSSSATMRFPAARSGGPSPGHSRSITCCCIDAAQQLLITGSADHTLCWWSLMAGSPASPIRVVSFRDASSNLTDTAAASPTQPPVHGGYPIDISLFHRRRNRYGPDGANGAAIGTEMALYVLVLDTEQVVRVFDALTGKLALVRAEESTAVSVSSSSGEARERHNVRLLRYDNVNGADRFLLGGLSLVPWYLTNRAESNAVNGHTEPVIFSAWCAALRCVVTADAHHVLLWRLGSSSTCENQPIEVLRAWRLSQGIRAIALCDDRRVDVDGPASACPTLLVTTIEQPQLVQYDCLAENPFQPTDTAASAEAAPLREPLALRHFALRTESGGTDTTAESVTALAAVCMSAEQQDVAYAASAQVAPTTCFAAVCQRETVPCALDAKDGTAGADAQSSLLLYVLRDSAPNAPATDATTSDLRLASREIHLSHRTTRLSRVAAAADVGEMVSVLPVPSRRLLVLGGRQLLYVASLFGLAAAATPCTPLTATAPPPQVGRKSTLSVSGDAARRVSALIPGRLSPVAADGEQDEESGGVLAQSSGGGAGGVAGAAAAASSTTSLEGYLSRLVFVDTEGEEGSRAAVAAAPSRSSAAPCLILSGSNVGVVQLWDAHCGAELWRCGVSMTQEPITALAVRSCAGRWLAAVGDQTGVVTLLDVTGAVVLSRSQQRQGPLPCKATTSRSSAVSATAADAFMIDRWQAHMESVSGLCFPAEEQQQPASPGCQLLSTGEDASVVAWTLPLIASSVFGCVKIGRKLFTSNTSYPLRPTGTELPWATREAYAKLRERYVRQSLFERDPELLSAFTALYAQPSSSNSGNGGGGGGLGGSASEESLVERAWDALTRDAASLLAATQRTPPSTAVPLNESMVREWCATLVTAAASAAPAAPAQPALAPQRRLGARASTTSNNGCADLNSALFSLDLLFAFADRCCSGAGVTRPAAQDSRGGPSTAVRAALRSAIRAVVQATTAADTQRSLHTSPVPEPPTVGGESAAAPAGKRLDAGSCAATSNTTTTQAARPAAELFSAVATVTALSRMPPSAAATAPPSGYHNPQHASTLSKSPPPNPPPLDVVTPTPVATEGPRINPPSPGLSPHRATPRNRDRDARSRQEPRAVAKVGTSPPTQSLGCRVTYYTSAPLVRTAPLSLDGVLSQPGDDAGSPGPYAHATRTSAARASDVPFTDCAAELFDGGDAVDTVSGDGDGGDDPRMGGSRAAVVVERVHRDRRRHGDVLQYIGARGGHPDPHDDLLTEVVAAARADRKLTRESISRYVVVKESCRAIVEDTTQQQRDHRKAGAVHFKAGGGAATAPAAAPPVPVRPVVSVTYLAPALARANVGANSNSRDNRSSAELSWYALRQRKRDAAEEGARLWNTPRVMRTLMGWSGTAPVDERRRTNRNAAGGAAAAPTALPVRGEQPSSLLLMRRGEGPTGTPPPSPGLVLPRILAAHAPDTSVARGGNDSGGSVDPNGHQHHRSDATAESRQAKAAAVLPALLHVPPTAAVDAAVHAGLPSRATLQAEMAAMQARMRQSVQQRAAQQRQQRIAAAASRSESALSGATTAAAAAPLPTADGGSESNGSVMPDDEDEVDTETEAEELVDDVRDPPLFSPAGPPAPAIAHDERAVSKQRLLSSSSLASAYSTVSLSPRPKMSLGSQRRAGQSGELVMPRQMSTVPLPSAVTRRDLFVHRSGGGSGDGGEREYEGGTVC